MRQPNLLLTDKYPLDKDDFSESPFHYVMFVCIDQLAHRGVAEITEVEINEFLQAYPPQLEIAVDNNFMEFIYTTKEIAMAENIDYYYDNVRKYSLLRAYKHSGIDITDIYDEGKSEESQRKRLNNLTVEDIINAVEGNLIKIRKNFQNSHNIEEYKAGTDFIKTKEMLQDSPLVGGSFQSGYLNEIFRGLYGFILRCGASGGGKTTLSVGDICKMSATEYWDEVSQSFVKNKSRMGGALFINTEMDLRLELEPILIAWISNVSRRKILDGQYEGDEEDRVVEAGRILIESDIYLVDDPEFTTKSLSNIIGEYAIQKNISVVCFDYCNNNGWVAKEIASETKVPQREDMVLLTLTDRLKQLSRRYDIPILSGTQLNGREKEDAFITEACLAGGKSQIRKTDGCMIILPPTKKELEMTQSILHKKGFGKHLEPNLVTHIVKGRASIYPKNIKVFQYADLGTGRVTDLFCTDVNNAPIKIKKMVIEYED